MPNDLRLLHQHPGRCRRSPVPRRVPGPDRYAVRAVAIYGLTRYTRAVIESGAN